MSSWYYSKQWIVLLSLCISLFFHNWQCGNLQGIVYSVLLQAMDCTPIFVYLYTFQRLTVQYLICSMCGWSCQQAADCIHIFVYLYIVFISLCICTLSISWQCSNLLKCQVAWLCQQAADCIHAFVYLYTFQLLAVQYLICSNVWSAMSTSSRLCTHISSCIWTFHTECQCHSHWKWVTTSLLRPLFKH